MSDTTQTPAGQTPTPRTDASEIDNSHFADWGTGPSGYVEVDFARSLETDLTAALAQLREAREAIEHALDGRLLAPSSMHKLRSALTTTPKEKET